MITRVTNSAMTDLFLRDINKNLTSISTLQHQISTGKKLDFPSDDPIGANRILDYTQTLAKITQYSDNISQADSLAQNVDGSLGTMEDVLLRARDLAVKGSNEAPDNQQSRNAVANEIDSLARQLWTNSNQKFDGKYLFSGFKTDVMPFEIKNELEFVTTPGGPTNTISMPNYTLNGVSRQSQAITASDSVKDILVYDTATATWGSVFSGPYNAASITSDPTNNTATVNGAAVNPFADGTKVRLVFDKAVSVTFNGDSGERNAEIDEGSTIGTSFTGATSDASKQRSIFGQYSSNGTETNSVEAFQYLFDLRDSLFKYNNTNPDTTIAQIQTGISDIDKIRQTITDVRAEQGGRVNRLDLAKNRLASMQIDTKSLLSQHEDVDMTEAISKLVLEQNTYQAALGAGARIIQTTLLNFLT